MLSVVLVESPEAGERSLTCFGALDVIMRRGQPEFRTLHLTAAAMGSTAALCERLAQLSCDRHVILGQPAIHGNFWDWYELLLAGSSFVFTISTHEDLAPSGLSFVSLSAARAAKISERMKLCLTRTAQQNEAARLALERAQLIWLSYVESRLDRRKSDSLFAAYQAWSTIERARPLPF